MTERKKTKNPIAVAARKRGGAGAGPHREEADSAYAAGRRRTPKHPKPQHGAPEEDKTG
jgi:hypothetical protein